jgi:hypothetical protein
MNVFLRTNGEQRGHGQCRKCDDLFHSLYHFSQGKDRYRKGDRLKISSKEIEK